MIFCSLLVVIHMSLLIVGATRDRGIMQHTGGITPPVRVIYFTNGQQAGQLII